MTTCQRVFDFICSYHKEHGQGPTHREIVEAVGVSLATVATHVNSLQIANRLLKVNDGRGHKRKYVPVTAQDQPPTVHEMAETIRELKRACDGYRNLSERLLRALADSRLESDPKILRDAERLLEKLQKAQDTSHV